MLTKEYEKSKIRLFVRDLIIDKIGTLEKFIDFTREATHEIKKTPKYDTFREEAHEELFQLERQLNELQKLRRGMARVLNGKSTVVERGALVITNKARFYVSVSLGQFFYENDRMYAISEESPMAKEMIGRQVGDEFVVNGIQQKIVAIL